MVAAQCISRHPQDKAEGAVIHAQHGIRMEECFRGDIRFHHEKMEEIIPEEFSLKQRGERKADEDKKKEEPQQQ